MRPTPSTTASPPPRQRPFTPHASVRGDGPSPAKRRRVATPISEPAAFIPSSTPSVELEAERRAASQRVLNVWSGLADKYARRIDEDDIIDLRTGNLVRDRGVLSNTSRPWTIGYFADVTDGESLDFPSDEGEDEDEDEDEDDDELGDWGSGSECGHQFTAAHLPPVQELDPEDARDLKEFLVAEKARKIEHGDDSESDSVVDVEAGSALALSDEESPDELEGYDETAGEGAILYQVNSKLSPPERLRTPVQLRTPPSSRSSETTPAPRFTTPSRRFFPEVVIPPRQNIKVLSPRMAPRSYPPHAQQSPPPNPQTYRYENQLNTSQMHLNPQIIIAQAMQYLAYAIVGQQFPDWTNPMLSPVPPCPPPCTPTTYPPPRPPPSSPFKDDSDSSFKSSPLYGRKKGKGKGKRVSFPDERRDR